MSKLSREARRRIYEEERARLFEEGRRADEAKRKVDEEAIKSLTPEDRRRIHLEESDRHDAWKGIGLALIFGASVAVGSTSGDASLGFWVGVFLLSGFIVGVWAGNWGRSPLLWAILGFLLPVIAALVLYFAGRKGPRV
jgi:hypothetical protein